MRSNSKLALWWKRGRVGYAFLAPFLLLFTVFTILPIIIGLGLSFTNYNMLETPQWVGITNYRQLILDDDVFITSLRNTLTFAVVVGPVGYIASFLLAWVINNLKGKNFFALAVYTPSITSAIAMTTVWGYFFSSDKYGWVNHILMSVGLISEPILWNQSDQTIMPVIIFISIWMGMGTGFLTFLAGFQNLSKEQLEAGRIDGLNDPVSELWYIIVPQMKPQLLFGAIMSIVNSFGVFDVAVQFAGLPSPNYAGHTVVAHLYDYAFIRFQMGYASAVSMMLFLMTFFIGRIITKLLHSDD
ncbi:MAG: sugar ABC transporter permease [Clostridia bacterium]|nr:sugar ABC transporter permease [Clostridia bacterium]